MSDITSVCIIWRRFLPYHLARIQGANGRLFRYGLCARGIAVTQGLSLDAVPHTPRRREEVGAAGEQVTLFDRPYGELPRPEIVRHVEAALDRIKPVSVAVNGWASTEARAGLKWCRRHGRPAILMSETMADSAPRRWWKEAIKSRIVRRFDGALVSGQRQAEYVARLGVPRNRVFVGYNAVDNAYFCREAERARKGAHTLRQYFGLPFRYFYANTRFLERKNVERLVTAYAKYLREAGTDAWDLVITGGGAQEHQVKTLICELRLNERVLLPGFVGYDSLPTYYGLASAFVHAALAEPWGLVVNEASASSLPLLVSRPVGAAYELLRNGENGFAFDPTDVDDIARSLRRMAETPDNERLRMGSRSREIASNYGPDRFGAGLASAMEASGVQPSENMPPVCQ